MRLVNSEYEIVFEFKEGVPMTLVLENRHAYSVLVGQLWRSFQGVGVEWILSEAEKNLNFSKKADLIYNPWALSCNDRRIIGKLYQEIASVVSDTMEDELSGLNSDIIRFMEKALMSVPYNLESGLDLDIQGLLKLYDVRFEEYEDSLLEKICNYIRAMHQICAVELFVFIGLKAYMEDEELEHLYKMAAYEKVYILMVEYSFGVKNEMECVKILDKDLCRIDL